MVINSVSANHLELSLTLEDPEFLRLAQLLGVSGIDLCKVSVIFVREGLTHDEFCENFQERGKRELAERGNQADLFGHSD